MDERDSHCPYKLEITETQISVVLTYDCTWLRLQLSLFILPLELYGVRQETEVEEIAQLFLTRIKI